ncbi:unnamed protein product [Durusdinium trenchii]|uniref:FAD-binding FR-type domain-containing protein n=1 Tax=Durusdinium trenchii TaxID=1381693 RepID=A0ABP0J890_9DINO
MWIFLYLAWVARGDVYLHNPRGSNNKLSEQSNNAQNQNRLFDSQNNAAGGYQIGDNCNPVCQDEDRNYDQTKEGAMKGTMTFYKGSELYIEWVVQHGCGVNQPNIICQMVLQYMCEKDNPALRDGTKRGNDNTAGGEEEPPTAIQANEPALGQHEPLSFYLDCKAHERQKGLYTADQNVNNDRGATATRQNPNGNNANNRHGLECPEERDYYPYWHPTPWHDIAIITDESPRRCEYYQKESQNVHSKGYCSEPEHNNPESCQDAGAEWKEMPAFNEPAPDCVAGVSSRDNHNGNARGGRPNYYLWRIPDHIEEGRCVLRLRYNMTSGDFRQSALATQNGPATGSLDAGDDYFHVNKAMNDPAPGQRRRTVFKGGPPILPQDPVGDWLDLGEDYRLQLQVNTNQYGRTFEDRTHTFFVRSRPAEVSSSARIVNYNVRGRRGNIVQVYPSVEYDFVPQELTVEVGDYLHFQWTGSDANAKGNAGNGRQSTDRSNLVQLADREENVPLPWNEHTLLYNAIANPTAEGKALLTRFAYLDQRPDLCEIDDNDQNSVQNCKQLNGATAYFDGGIVQMQTVGQHKVASTRNNDFSNRSQKATIHVIPRSWSTGEVIALVAGLAVFCMVVAYLCAAVYAYKNPSSWLFSKRHRPRLCVLRYLVGQQRLNAAIEKRKEWKREERAKWKALNAGVSEEKEDKTKEAKGEGLQAEKVEDKDMADPRSKSSRFVACLVHMGLGEGQRVAMLVLILLNLASFVGGYMIHVGLGFQESFAFPLAKGAGFALDMDLAILLLPTLKSLQTALRGKGGRAREWIPLDDPISFHIAVATLVAINSFIHICAHFIHMGQIASSPKFQSDPLEAWDLTSEELVSGTSVEALLLTRANFTGLLITSLMFVIYVTALPSVRRATCCVARRCGGFRLFQQAHSIWPIVYLLLLIHTTPRFWIWMFFPAIFMAVDRILLTQRQRYPAVLVSARLLLFDVIHLTFEIPENFTYQAGQYVHLYWKGEWHPFTLTSAPEERHLTLHIRASSSLDWCSALRRHLMVEAPKAQNESSEAKEPDPGTTVEYEKLVLPSGRVCCKAQPLTKSSFKGIGSSDKVSLDVSFDRSRRQASTVRDRAESTRTEDSVALMERANLPPGTVELQLQGPFGAPAQRVWEFKTVMVVGAGIGVTPFVSILRSVQMRKQQQHLLYTAGDVEAEGTASKRRTRREAAHCMAPEAPWSDSAGAVSADATRAESSMERTLETPEKEKSPKKKKVTKTEVPGNSSSTGGILGLAEITPSVVGARTEEEIDEKPTRTAMPSQTRAKAAPRTDKVSSDQAMIERLVTEVIPVPERIHFYWIVRNQQELDWFYDLLATAVEGPAKDLVEVNLFTTGEVELSAVKQLKCVHHQYFGRPNWNRIFKGCKAQHMGDHIGVFLCGSPVIGQELARQSAKHSDPPDQQCRTRFSFFKEHF